MKIPITAFPGFRDRTARIPYFTKGYVYYVIVADMNGTILDVIPFTSKAGRRAAINKLAKIASTFERFIFTADRETL